MGAQLWHHETPWNDDPATALQTLQAEFAPPDVVAELIQNQLKGQREHAQFLVEDGDEFGLLEDVRLIISYLEQISKLPVPNDPASRVALVRNIHNRQGDEVGNVLDVLGTSDSREHRHAQILTPEEIQKFCSTSQPTKAQAMEAISNINTDLDRAEAVCFPFYEGGSPTGWHFVGNTAD
ncbi:MAG: hypothetical protein U0903_21340 [Planctomycetales bacterium]